MSKKARLFNIFPNAVILFLFLLYLAQLVGTFGNMNMVSWSISGGVAEQVEEPPADQDTMTYARFKDLENSRQFLRSHRELMDRSIGNGFEGPLIGMRTISECDTCTNPSGSPAAFYEPTIKKYYIALTDYSLKQDPNILFYVRNGKNFLQYPKWDKEDTIKGKVVQHSGHWESKEVPFRFASADFDNRAFNKNGTVLIPIGQKTYSLLNPIVFILTLLIVLSLSYIYIVLPIHILLEISRGRAFTLKNVRRLRITAWAFLLPACLIIPYKYFLSLLFHRYITADLHLSLLETLGHFFTLFVAGVVFSIIAKAFKKGYLLQQEQDLTI